GDRRGEIGLQRELAVGADGREEGAQRDQRLVGPVALVLRGREAEAVGQQHEARGDLLRGREVFLQQGGGEHEGVARVGEALAGGAVGRKVARGLEVDAGQVADRVVVLGVAEAADDDAAGVAGAGLGLDGEEVAGPGDDDLALLGGEGRALLGGHLAVFEILDEERPGLEVLADLGEAGEAFEVEVALFLFGGVAGEAVLGEEGADALGVVAAEVRVRRGGGRGGQKQEDREQQPGHHAGSPPRKSRAAAPSTPGSKRYTVYHTRGPDRNFTESGDPPKITRWPGLSAIAPPTMSSLRRPTNGAGPAARAWAPRP